MLALASAWIGLISLLIATTMWLYRPAFTDLGIALVLYFGAPGSMCLGGMVLWAHRKEDSASAGVAAQRLQARVGIILALIAIVIVYALVICAKTLMRPSQ